MVIAKNGFAFTQNEKLLSVSEKPVTENRIPGARSWEAFTEVAAKCSEMKTTATMWKTFFQHRIWQKRNSTKVLDETGMPFRLSAL